MKAAHPLRNIAVVFAGLIFLYCALSLVAAHQFTSPHNKRIAKPSQGFPTPMENVQFHTADSVRIAGWFIGDSSGQAIILLHGYRANRLEMLQRAQWLHGLGYAVLLYDARGHGESDAHRVSIGYRERLDLQAAAGYLKNRGYSQQACLGISQGAATIIFAGALLDSIKCVILESPYTTAQDAVDRRFRHHLKIPGWPAGSGILLASEFLLDIDADAINPLQKIVHLRPPKLLISGQQDKRTWPGDIKRLYTAAESPKMLYLFPDAGHADLLIHDPHKYRQTVRTFLQQHFPTQSMLHD